MTRVLSVQVCVLVAALMAAGCSSGGGTTTSPTAPVSTDTFSGTVGVGLFDTHSFTVKLSGEVDVTLTAAGPPSTIYMGLAIGTPTGTSCSVLSGGSAVVQAGTTAQLTGSLNAGQYCVVVYDAGNQTADVTYAVTVSHF